MPPRASIPLSSLSASKPSLYTHCSSCLRREFSSTPVANTRLRRAMFAWLEGPGENFRHPLPGSTNYLSAYDYKGRLVRAQDDAQSPAKKREGEPDELDAAAEEKKLSKESRDDLRPFPLNHEFVSESVLSEPLRQEIWRRAQIDKKSVRTISVELGVEMRRVGAVVRLVELERRMKRQGQPLALPYARAIHSMLPTTPYSPKNIVPHESINDLPVHPLTEPQLFYPTSESRAFNRTDAGRAFSAAPRLPDAPIPAPYESPAWQDTTPEMVGKGADEQAVLKPADARIPHPHLVAFAQDQAVLRGKEDEIQQRYETRLAEDAAKREATRQKKLDRQEASKTRVDTKRWQFIVTDVTTSASLVGKQGRGRAPGIRYGVPHEDRKKGQVKIPTKVEV